MIPLAEATAWLAAHGPRLDAEPVPIHQAAGRAVAHDVAAAALPSHKLAAIDGLAIRAAETEGASDYAPVCMHGTPIQGGAPMPPGTDAVLPAFAHDGRRALLQIAVGSGVVQAGHDAAAGVVIAAGTMLRPLHIALLAQIGHTTVDVIRRPRVDLRTAPAKSGPDALRPLLLALLAEAGAITALPPDLILLAGRSGHGVAGIAALDNVFADGIAIRPGETTALGTVAGCPAILLRGDLLACATTFALLAAPALRRRSGRAEPTPISVTLTRKVISGLGQLDAIRLRVDGTAATPLGPAEGGSLTPACDATALLLVPAGSEGYPKGATIQAVPL